MRFSLIGNAIFFRNEEKLRDDVRYIVTSVDHVMFLGYHVAYTEVLPNDGTYLVLKVESVGAIRSYTRLHNYLNTHKI